MSEQKNCIVSLKQKKTIEFEICKSFDFGTALGKVYPLLQIIFEKLPFEDLKSAALVNGVWTRYANEEFQKRNKASWISVIKSKTSKLSVEKSYNFKYDSVAFGMIFYNHTKIKLNKFMCVHGDPVTRVTFSEYLVNEIVPPDVDFWTFSCSHVYSPKLIKGYKCYFTGVFIPEIPNIKVKKFIASPNKIDRCFEKNIPEDEHIHCVLLFTLSSPNSIIKKFIEELLARQNADTVAIGGGVVSGCKPFVKDATEKVIKSDTLFCIAITQGKDNTAEFDSYSLVIPEEVCVEEHLLEFKEKIQLREHSFAFRICCAAKDHKEIETALFNKIFPKTFVVGLDAQGEMGWDKFKFKQPEDDIPDPKKRKVKLVLCHQYTTIIVIMTWGKKIQTQT